MRRPTAPRMPVTTAARVAGHWSLAIELGYRIPVPDGFATGAPWVGMLADASPEYRLGYRLAVGSDLHLGIVARCGTAPRRMSRRTTPLSCCSRCGKGAPYLAAADGAAAGSVGQQRARRGSAVKSTAVRRRSRHHGGLTFTASNGSTSCSGHSVRLRVGSPKQPTSTTGYRSSVPSSPRTTVFSVPPVPEESTLIPKSTPCKN